MARPSFAEAARPAVAASLQPDESLEGIVAATHSKTFSGTLYGLGVTADRLILQPLDRKMGSKGDAILVTPGDIQSARLDGGGGDWWSVGSAVLDATALAVDLRLTDGTKMTLRMMRGGDGALSSLGGGEEQRAGVEALVGWMQRHLPH